MLTKVFGRPLRTISLCNCYLLCFNQLYIINCLSALLANKRVHNYNTVNIQYFREILPVCGQFISTQIDQFRFTLIFLVVLIVFFTVRPYCSVLPSVTFR